MIGVISYLIVCVAVSGILTFLYVMTRPIRARDELRSWRVWMAVMAFVVATPYLIIEAQTRIWGDKMKEAVDDAVYEAGIEGPLLYFKVLLYQGDKARVLAVGQEETTWGGKDNPAMQMTLARKDGKWSAESYNIIYSDNRNLDGIVFPPFW